MNTNDLADYLVPLLRDMRPHRSSMTEAANLIERLRAERDEAQMEYADALIARDAAIRRAEVVTHNNGCWVCADEVGIVGAEHAGRCRDHSEQIESECAELTVERDAAIRRAEVAEADADRLAALVWPYPTTRGYGSTAANALRAHAKAVAERGPAVTTTEPASSQPEESVNDAV